MRPDSLNPTANNENGGRGSGAPDLNDYEVGARDVERARNSRLAALDEWPGPIGTELPIHD
jgi:hypothetical protein